MASKGDDGGDMTEEEKYLYQDPDEIKNDTAKLYQASIFQCSENLLAPYFFLEDF
jgi:hypothetical protein